METMTLTIEGPDGLLIALDVGPDQDRIDTGSSDATALAAESPANDINQDRHPALTGSDFWKIR